MVRFFIGICCVVVMCRLKSVKAAQSFSEQPKASAVKPGGTVTLKCNVKDKVGDCMWQKDYTPIRVSPGKYEWAGDEKSGDCSLKILDAQPDLDEGSWSCQVTWSSVKARDALTSTKIVLSVGENCTPGKPCSKNPSPQGKQQLEVIEPTKVASAELTQSYKQFSKHHRVKDSSFQPKFDRHPFSAIFSRGYWARTHSPFIVEPKKVHHLFEGLHHLHFHHDHDLAFGKR